jgi:Starch-binding associating with outer membrane
MKKSIYSILMVSILAIWGCKREYLDINTNPNQPTSATPELVLSSSLNATAGRWVHRELGAFWGGHWSPSGSVSGFRTGIWTGIYDNLNDYDYVEKEATKAGKSAVVGIAKIMKVYNYQILVDTYGNIPYKTALKGTDVIRPTYDEAQAIYDDFIVQLTSAIELLKEKESSANVYPRQSDIVFKGDLKQWIKFANTLKLKILLRQINVAGKASFIQTEIGKIVTEGSGFVTADVVSNPGYLKSDGKQNQFWETYYQNAAGTDQTVRSFYATSLFFVQTMGNLGDFRGSGGFYGAGIGVPFGEPPTDTYLYANVAEFNTKGLALCKDFNQDSYLMLASESYFLQAEAVERGLMTGNAKALFESGVLASFINTYLATGYTVAEATTDAGDYYSKGNPLTDYAAATNKIETIITQKWIAGFGHGSFEAWCDFRRTGFPKVPLSTQAISGQHPTRLLYPVQEEQTNAANVGSQGVNNIFTQKIFWDKD